MKINLMLPAREMKRSIPSRAMLLGWLIGSLSTNGFAALGPYAFTQPSWAVTSTLNGMAGPNGVPSVAWFEWGATTNYGHTTAPVSVGASTGVVRVSATLSNLAMGKIYHARLVVSNAVGVTWGSHRPLITPGHMKVALLGSGYCSPFPLPLRRHACLPPCANNDGHSTPPLLVPPDTSNIVAIAPGLVLCSDGSVLPAFQGNLPMFSNVVAAAGGYPQLGLLADGTVVATDGNVPPGLSHVIAVTRNGANNLALRADGSLVAWGAGDPNLVTDLPPGLNNIVAIAGGPLHSLALRIDGTVVAWGDNSLGQTDVPPGLSNVVAIAADWRQSAAVRRDGTVVAWPETQPSLWQNLSNVVDVVVGETSLALHGDGTITETGNTWGTCWRRKLFSNVAEICGGLALGLNQAPFSNQYPLTSLQSGAPLLFLAAFDANLDTLQYRVASLPTSGTLYQVENGERGAVIRNQQTVVTDPEHRVIFEPAADGDELDPSFTFIASDGELDSLPITVEIPLTPRFPRVRLENPGNCFFPTVRFIGDTNSSYRVWGSTNFLDWEVLGTASLTPSDFSFTDYATDPRARFYKVTTP